MSLTLRHFWAARRSRKPMAVQDSSYFDLQSGIVTLQYPHQTLPVPDNGRYQLDCEIDDCIVCDKCAKICPVDCIDIEPIKSSEVISYTSDGSPVRLYAAKFDIDMAKCCFCGLCTTVCPTECLTMTNEYDFSVVDITDMNFQFSNLSPEQANKKRKLYEQFLAEKEALKQVAVVDTKISTETPKPKPVFKPSFKPSAKPTEGAAVGVPNNEAAKVKTVEVSKPKPAFKPSFKPASKPAESTAVGVPNNEIAKVETVEVSKPKPAFKPSFKPTPKPAESTAVGVPNNEVAKVETKVIEMPKSKPVFRPTMKITPKNTN